MSIVLEKLVKHYALQTVVDHVSLDIADGELLVLLGASGSGKSTILRMIAGLMPVDEGRIFLHGRDVTELSPQARNVGFVFQNYSLFRHMTVAQNIEFGLEIRRVPKAARATRRDELLEMAGLAGLGGRYPRQLSGGQQQRVAVARALAFEPSVLLLDEPFGALDVKIRAQLRQTLKAVQRQLGVTTILVTHDQEEAFELADRIGVIDKGRLLEVGTPMELYRRPRHEFVAQFLGSATLLGGQWEAGHLHLGALTLPAPTAPPDLPPDGQVAVLLRPEALKVATNREQLSSPLLGKGTVEEVDFLGALQRVHVRLQPLPGIRSLAARYGEGEVTLQVAQLSGEPEPTRFEVGQPVWVGIQAFHLMPRVAPSLLLCVTEGWDDAALHRAGRLLPSLSSGPVTVLAVGRTLEAAEQRLKGARQQLGHRPGIHFKARRGAATEEILREIQGGHYDLALIQGDPSGGTSDAGENVVEGVVRHAPTPVLVMRGDQPSLRRVLLCTAAGEPGKLDVLLGGQLAHHAGASATLLYVVPPPIPVTPLSFEYASAPTVAYVPTATAALRHLEQGVQTLHGQGIRAGSKMRQGRILDEILAEAAEGDYDLIVVGGHLGSAGLSFLEHDLASDVVRTADRPVLVVRGALA